MRAYVADKNDLFFLFLYEYSYNDLSFLSFKSEFHLFFCLSKQWIW